MGRVRGTELHKLLQAGRSYQLVRRQVIQTSDDRQVVNLIVSGFIKRYLITNDGSIGVQITYGPGDVFPLTIVYRHLFDQSLYDGPETFYYEAMTDCEIRSTDASTLVEAVRRNPALYADLMQEAGVHLKSCVNSLENMALKTSGKRVAHQLVYLAKTFGEPTERGLAITTPITHQDLADILSLTRETVSTSMVQLRKQKLLALDKNKSILVPDVSKLEAEAFS